MVEISSVAGVVAGANGFAEAGSRLGTVVDGLAVTAVGDGKVDQAIAAALSELESVIELTRTASAELGEGASEVRDAVLGAISEITMVEEESAEELGAAADVIEGQE